MTYWLLVVDISGALLTAQREITQLEHAAVAAAQAHSVRVCARPRLWGRTGPHCSAQS
jgi:hydroxymethylpyrimidine pyrophosphatase-like HAD family hydrolase